MTIMENSEEVLQILERYTKLKQKDIPKELEDYLGYVARTGDTVYRWSNVKYLFREKLIHVIKDFHDSTPNVDDLPQYPNVDPFNYESMKSTLLERLEMFNAAPFTIQRLCELLTDPRKQYSRIDKFMRALEKNILVVSTVEPGRKQPESENGDSLDSVVNGDLSLDVNVDIDMEGESIYKPLNISETTSSVAAQLIAISSANAERIDEGLEVCVAKKPRLDSKEDNNTENKPKSDSDSDEASDDSDNSDNKEVQSNEDESNDDKIKTEITVPEVSVSDESVSEKNDDVKKEDCEAKVVATEASEDDLKKTNETNVEVTEEIVVTTESKLTEDKISKCEEVKKPEKIDEKETLNVISSSSEIDIEEQLLNTDSVNANNKEVIQDNDDTKDVINKELLLEEKTTDETNEKQPQKQQSAEPDSTDTSLSKKTSEILEQPSKETEKSDDNNLKPEKNVETSNSQTIPTTSKIEVTSANSLKTASEHSQCDEGLPSSTTSASEDTSQTSEVPSIVEDVAKIGKTTDNMSVEDTSASASIPLVHEQEQEKIQEKELEMPVSPETVINLLTEQNNEQQQVKEEEGEQQESVGQQQQQISDQPMDENVDASMPVCSTVVEENPVDSSVMDEVIMQSESDQMATDPITVKITEDKVDLSGMDVDDTSQEEAMDQ